MSEKLIQTRIIHKHAQESDWDDASLVPLQSELLIYDSDENHNFPRFKLGDGTSLARELPFLLTNPVFVGTDAEYKAADAAGLVPIGTIVIITDDENGTSSDDPTNSGGTSPKLGEGILGLMILG